MSLKFRLNQLDLSYISLGYVPAEDVPEGAERSTTPDPLYILTDGRKDDQLLTYMQQGIRTVMLPLSEQPQAIQAAYAYVCNVVDQLLSAEVSDLSGSAARAQRLKTYDELYRLLMINHPSVL